MIASAAVRTVAQAATNTQVVNLWNPSATRRLGLISIEIFGATAIEGSFGLVRTSARGTQTATLLGLLHDDIDTFTVQGTLDTAWSVAPTFTAASLLKRFHGAAAIGTGVIWLFNPDKFKIKATNGLALITTQAITTGQALDVGFTWDE